MKNERWSEALKEEKLIDRGPRLINEQLDKLHKGRAFCARAEATLVSDAVIHNVADGNKNADLGSGDGALSKYLQGVGIKLIEIEREAPAIRRRIADSPCPKLLVPADLLKLPFQEGSLDNAISLTTFHELERKKLDKAMQQVFLSLRSGGRFIHLQDAVPGKRVIFLDYLEKNILPLPMIDTTSGALRLILIKSGDMRNLSRRLKRKMMGTVDMSELIEEYARDPFYRSDLMINHYNASDFEVQDRHVLTQVRAVLEHAARKAKIDLQISPSFDEIFQHKLINAGKRSGLRLVKSERMTSTADVPPNDTHMEYGPTSNCFLIDPALGIEKAIIEDDPPAQGLVREIATMQLLVMEKA